MEANERLEGVHPAGEGQFTFPTAGGRVRMAMTDDALTPYGGLVPWAAFTRHLGIAEGLAANCPVERTSPNNCAAVENRHTLARVKASNLPHDPTFNCGIWDYTSIQEISPGRLLCVHDAPRMQELYIDVARVE